MSKILVYTSPALGHLYPLTPTMIELVERGHTVRLRTRADSVELMQGLGIDSDAVDPRIESAEHEDWRAKNPRKALELSVGLLAERAEHESAELASLIEQEQPDLVLVDSNCFGALTVAEAWGGPWAAFCAFPLPLASRDAPPFGPGLKPARGAAGRLRDRLLTPLILGQLSKAMLPPVNRLRAQQGLATLDRADQIFARPPLMLSMTAEPFEYHRSDWPESIVMVGACPWEPPSSPPEWLGEIKRPIVLVTTSSEFQNDGKLVRTAFGALADEDVEVIATVPGQDAAQFTPPSNGRVVSFVGHQPILERAVCAITHGGMGATQKALASGVPVCVVPFGRDQLEVARRVTEAGAGTQLAARRLSPVRLREAVTTARGLATGARRVADGYDAAGGASTAAEAIERQLAAVGAPAAPSGAL